MSIKWMEWVFDNSPFSGTQQVIHLVIADYAGVDGVCWPGRATIAARARCSERYVRETMAEMEELGLIVRSQREGMTNIYKLLRGRHGPEDDLKPWERRPTDEEIADMYAKEGGNPSSRGGGNPSSPGGKSDAKRGGTPVPLNLEIEPSITTGRKRQKDDIFESVALVCGIDIGNLTKTERGRLNDATKQLRDVEATPGDIERRAREYRKRYPDATLTPQALVGNWSALSPPPGKVLPTASTGATWQPTAPLSAEEKQRARDSIRELAESLRQRGMDG